MKKIGEATNDREPEPKPFLACARRFRLVKLLENRVDLVSSDTDAGIGDFQAALVAAAIATHCHVATVGVTNRVRHQVLDDLAQQVRVTANCGRAWLRIKPEPLVAGLASEFRRQAIDQPLHRKILDFRRHGARVQATDIEERIQQIGHCRQRVLLAFDHFQRTLVLHRTAQRAVQEAKRLHGLAQVVAGGSEECVVGLLSTLCGLPGSNNLLFHALAPRHVTNHARDKRAARGDDGTEADFHREFTAILAPPDEIEPGPHGP